MTMKKYISYSLVFFFMVLVVVSCKKDGEELTNPYEGLTVPVDNDNPDADALPEGSFAWLHAKVFRPTCANSGCHDGTFEPEFRTISSAYNSLVNHPVIANDPGNNFSYRVVPGNHQQSWLYQRLTVEVDNTSGMMPLATDPGSDWPELSNFYVEKIAQWIDDGAKDMFGNPAPAAGVNGIPLAYGMAVFPTGNTTNPYPREENPTLGVGSILVPTGPVDLWFGAVDDNAGVNNFTSFSMKVSSNITDFSNAVEVPCTLSGPITALDFTDNTTQLYYKATFDFSGIPAGEQRYVRVYINDGVQPSVTELPNSSSNYFWFLLFSLKTI